MSAEILAELYATSGGAGWTNNTGWLLVARAPSALGRCDLLSRARSPSTPSNNLVGT